MASFWASPLSNFARLPVRWGGLVFPTSEAVYQAMKTRDPELREQIRTAPTAWTAKRIAYEHKSLWRPDWPDVRVQAMRWTLRHKLRDNAHVLVPILTRSRGLDIVEPTRRDLFWGGYWQNGELVGENWLGRLWMELRDEIVQP